KRAEGGRKNESPRHPEGGPELVFGDAAAPRGPRGLAPAAAEIPRTAFQAQTSKKNRRGGVNVGPAFPCPQIGASRRRATTSAQAASRWLIGELFFGRAVKGGKS